MKKISITHVSNEHNRWLRGLDFYETEIGIQKGILTEIASKNTGADVMKEVEHFENQFKVQQDAISRLRHDIRMNLERIADQAKHQSAGYIDGDLVNEHTSLGAQYDTEEHIIKGIIHSFRRFAEQWM